MKRQRGRNRGGGNSGGKPQQQNANRAFDSNGPEGVKVRGNAQHVFEKYQQLARDAGSAGDRVLAENYLQHAEHYFRVVRAMQPQRPASEILGRDQFTSGFDIDFEDESGAQAQQIADAEQANAPYSESNEGETEARSGGWRDDRPQRDDRPRDDRPRDRYRDDRQGGDRQGGDRQGADRQANDRQDRQGGDRYRDDRPYADRAPREDRPSNDRPASDRQANDRQERQGGDRPRDDRPREERQNSDRPRNFEGGGRRDRFRDRDDRAERPDRDPLAVVEPQSTPLVAPAREEPASPVLRDESGGESRAPAFMKSTPRVKPQSAPLPTAEDTATEEAAKRPKRRRAPRTFEGGAAPSETEEV